MTVAEFRAMPEPAGDLRWELHYGEITRLTRPKLRHAVLQKSLVRLLESFAPVGSYVDVEVAFRAFPEYDLRGADVAWLSPERWASADLDDNIRGAPDLVIEVRSAGNTDREMAEKRVLCLTHGGQEFWLVDDSRRQVDVTRQNGATRSYRPGDAIPLDLTQSGALLPVDQIFDALIRR